MIIRLVARFFTSQNDLFRRVNLWAKGTLLARLLGDPLNGLNDPWLEKIAWNAAVKYHPTQSLHLSQATQCTPMERLVIYILIEQLRVGKGLVTNASGAN